MSIAQTTQEAVMGKAVPTSHHPAVVLRSHYNAVRALLAVAMIAVVGLTVAVVIVAREDDQAGGAAALSAPSTATQDGIRYDGGPEEGSAAIVASPPARIPAAGTRYDGGPEEGTRGAVASPQPMPAGTRYDGGPDEGSRGPSGN
jgi:hypothetical protein